MRCPRGRSRTLRHSLSDNQIGDEGISSLAAAVSEGALPNLTTLALSDNQISDAGIASLADAVSKGAMPKLAVLGVLWMEDDLAPFQKLKKACDHRKISFD